MLDFFYQLGMIIVNWLELIFFHPYGQGVLTGMTFSVLSVWTNQSLNLVQTIGLFEGTTLIISWKDD